jgi:hypothetical protein
MTRMYLFNFGVTFCSASHGGQFGNDSHDLQRSNLLHETHLYLSSRRKELQILHWVSSLYSV